MSVQGLGRKLMELRLARNLSQRDLAQLGGASAHLTATSISKVERGERYPNLATLEAYARALKIRFVIDPGGTSVEPLRPMKLSTKIRREKRS